MNETIDSIPLQTYLKNNWKILVFGVLFFVIGIWTDFEFLSKRRYGLLYFINLLPGIMLFSIWYFGFKYQNKQWLIINVGVPLTLLVSYIIFLINSVSGVFTKALGPVGQITDLSRYTEVREQIGDSELARHFPTSIPDNAQNVKFEYVPGFLQGGEIFQLRMKLPQSEIDNLYNEFRPKAKNIFIGGETNDHANLPGGVPTTFFYTSDTEDQSFPVDYEILVLNAEPMGTPKFQWNHGFSYGVAISQEKSEIVYWSEYW